MVVVGDIDDSPPGKVGIEDNVPAVQVVNLGLQQFGEVVGHDLGGHAHRNALGAQQEQQRDLGRQPDRFLHAAVVGVDEFGQIPVEQGFAGQRRQAAFDVAGAEAWSPVKMLPKLPWRSMR
jgi:hypothetical protein